MSQYLEKMSLHDFPADLCHSLCGCELAPVRPILHDFLTFQNTTHSRSSKAPVPPLIVIHIPAGPLTQTLVHQMLYHEGNFSIYSLIQP